MTLYPDGYGTAEITLERMVAKHGGKMHPEFARRFFAWIVSEGGRMGVGGGWRSTQPIKPGFAPPGMSFHETQVFSSGFAGYAAVDLVHRQLGQVHRSPSWAEGESAKEFGLHTFVSGEPWHVQCIEMRGYQTWVNAGRPDPQPIALPGDKPTPPPPPIPPPNGDTMLYIAKPTYAGADAGTPWLAVFESGQIRRALNADVKYAQANGVAIIDQDSREQHEYAIAKFGI